MDVFEAVNSRIACRHFLDQNVDPDIVRRLVEGAAKAASSSNLQPWNVYAVTGEPLQEIKRQAPRRVREEGLASVGNRISRYARKSMGALSQP